MSGDGSTEETVTRTFRVNKEWDEILHKQADWQGISVSALIDQIIRRYVVSERYQTNLSVISMDSQAFLRLLQKINDNDIKDVGLVSGRLLPEEEILKRGLPKDFQSFVWLMEEVYGRYRGWFNIDHYTTKDQNILHLRHCLNYKWSAYLRNFFVSMLKSNLDIEITTEAREESITLYIQNKQIKTVT